MALEELRYTVLVYEDRFGVWVKIPEFNVQCLTEDWEVGLDIIEDQLHFDLEQRRKKGELVPERVVRTVKHVDKGEYGSTQVELDEARYLQELAEEYSNDEDGS